MSDALGVGFIGVPRPIEGVVVVGAWSPYPEELRDAGVKRYRAIGDLIADSRVDAVWLGGPLAARVERMEEITDAVVRARGKLVGVACEAPLAADVAAARRMVELAAHAGIKHGYLEPRAFAPDVVRRYAELWARGRPDHVTITERDPVSAVLVMRLLLAARGEPLANLQVTKSASGPGRMELEFETPDGQRVVGAAVIGSEPGESGQAAMDAHFARAFLGLEDPRLTYEDGLDAIRLVGGT